MHLPYPVETSMGVLDLIKFLWVIPSKAINMEVFPDPLNITSWPEKLDMITSLYSRRADDKIDIAWTKQKFSFDM
jgi:hypothetical protein